MSNIVTKTFIQNGNKATLFVYLESDGNDGELSNQVLIDPQADFGLDNSKQFTILQVWYGFSWFDVQLKFDDLVPYPSWTLVRDAGGYHDFRYFGGLKDRSGIDHTSKLIIDTKGFAPLGSIGTMVIELRKN